MNALFRRPERQPGVTAPGWWRRPAGAAEDLSGGEVQSGAGEETAEQAGPVHTRPLLSGWVAVITRLMFRSSSPARARRRSPGMLAGRPAVRQSTGRGGADRAFEGTPADRRGRAAGLAGLHQMSINKATSAGAARPPAPRCRSAWPRRHRDRSCRRRPATSRRSWRAWRPAPPRWSAGRCPDRLYRGLASGG
jgi:hypothetical protein